MCPHVSVLTRGCTRTSVRRHVAVAKSARRKALPAWLHECNHHRPHIALGNRPPITRLTNLFEQYNQPDGWITPPVRQQVRVEEPPPSG